LCGHFFLFSVQCCLFACEQLKSDHDQVFCHRGMTKIALPNSDQLPDSVMDMTESASATHVMAMEPTRTKRTGGNSITHKALNGDREKHRLLRSARREEGVLRGGHQDRVKGAGEKVAPGPVLRPGEEAERGEDDEELEPRV
jgi:hypothetical protein